MVTHQKLTEVNEAWDQVVYTLVVLWIPSTTFHYFTWDIQDSSNILTHVCLSHLFTLPCTSSCKCSQIKIEIAVWLAIKKCIFLKSQVVSFQNSVWERSLPWSTRCAEAALGPVWPLTRSPRWDGSCRWSLPAARQPKAEAKLTPRRALQTAQRRDEHRPMASPAKAARLWQEGR